MTDKTKKTKRGFYDFVEMTSKKGKKILRVGGSILIGVVVKAVVDKYGDNK
ncbi:hypothetical protein [Streptococcus salivarius]|jgi:hypothetical protein|nr:hypothetical protein [Streptococcus salivarius]